MSDYVILDPRFERLIIGHAKLEKLWTGSRWAEGPVYVPAGKYLVWSDIPNDRLLRYDETDGLVSVFAHPCGYHNGHTLDNQGRIVSCEHQGRRVSRIDHDGITRPIATHFDGKRLNSPNDVVVKSDDSIWFTDPSYGIDTSYEGDAATSEIGACNVYRVDARTGAVTAVITDMVRPNGLAFSVDERTLYVADTGSTHVRDTPRAIRAYDVSADGLSVKNGRTFSLCDAGLYDGFRVDWQDNIWTSTGAGVYCYAKDGTLIGKIVVPETVANVTFGGPKRNRLYIAGHTSLYAIYLATHAAGWSAA